MSKRQSFLWFLTVVVVVLGVLKVSGDWRACLAEGLSRDFCSRMVLR